MGNAIVIGSGIGGIATAIRLAVKGHKVKLFEANDYAGGKIAELTANGYRFDAGPSLFTLPHLVEELFTLAGKDPKHYFEYERLDEICRYFYEDGVRLTAHSDPEAFCLELATKLGIPKERTKAHLASSQQMYELTEKLFLQSSLHKLSSYLKPHACKALFHMGKLKTTKVMHDENLKQFQEPHATQLFDRYATYNGSNPYKAPATLHIIPHLEYNLGAYFPKSGMYSIATSLFILTKELGVEFHFNEPAKEIKLRGKQVIGVETPKGFYPSEIVVSNVDISTTYTKLLPSLKRPTRLLKQEKSSSGLVFYWGIKKTFPELGLHNIFFSSDYQTEFNYLFEKKTVYDDPTVYLNISSKMNAKDAPEGKENWFTMINVPNNQGQDWDEFIAKSKACILAKLSRILKEDISGHIEFEAILDPRDIEQKTGSTFGALYGNSSNNQFAAFLRHANFSSSVKGLYFCGGSVHPGGGIPLCLFSAKIVAGLITEEY